MVLFNHTLIVHNTTEKTLFALAANYRDGHSSGLMPAKKWLCSYLDPRTEGDML